MKKIINIIIFIMLLGWLLYYFVGDQLYNLAKSVIATNTNTWIDQIILSWDSWSNTSFSKNDFDNTEFQTWSSWNYMDYIVRTDSADPIEDKYLSYKDFIWLFGYYQKKLHSGKTVNVDKFLNTVLNLPTDKINYDIYINILTKLHNTNKLTDSELQYYKTFGNIMQLKFDDFNHDINLIDYSWLSQEKIDFIKSIYKSNDLYKSYKNPPKYYLIALLWSNLITNWYYEPARRLATEILKINDSYILTNQIMAYYNFSLWKNTYSEEFLTKLIKLDDANSNLYKYLLWITYYESGQYSEAVWILQNIDKSDYTISINKYLLSSYLYLWDRNNAKIIIQNMTKDDSLDMYDYQTIWQYLFYPSHAYEDNFFLKPEKYVYYQSNRDFADQLIYYCKNYISQKQITSNICNLWEYGKIIADTTDKDTLDSTVKQITNGNLWVDYIYAWVGDYYTYIWRKDLAKPYYIQSYKSSDDEDYKNNLKNKVIQLFQIK